MPITQHLDNPPIQERTMFADFHGDKGDNGGKHMNENGQEEQEPEKPYIRGIQVSLSVALSIDQ